MIQIQMGENEIKKILTEWVAKAHNLQEDDLDVKLEVYSLREGYLNDNEREITLTLQG